jgi:hypothetical protein
LRCLLGLEPTPDGLIVAPHIPDRFGWLGLEGVPGHWGRADAVSD